jgi:transposase-like protein
MNLTDPRFQDADKAREYLEAERWPNGPVCPHCGADKDSVTAVVAKKAGAKTRPGLYQCNVKECRQQFTVTVGTVFERSHVPLNKWLLATYLLSASKKGMSSHQLHRTLGVAYKTAWFMAHRIREAMNEENPGPLGGEGQIVEADETYIGKGAGARRRKAVLGPGKGWVVPRDGQEKLKVVTLVEREGRARSIHVRHLTANTVRDVLVKNADRRSHLMTDESNVYRNIGSTFASHRRVNHSKHEYARGEVSTNTIEGFFSIFKRGMKGIYQHCSERHLQRYLNEFDFRYSNRKVSDTERALIALKGIEGKRLYYRRPHGIGA